MSHHVKYLEVSQLADSHYYVIAPDKHGAVSTADVSKYTWIGKYIGSGLTFQKYLVVRNGIFGMAEGFIASTMLGLVFFQTDIVLFWNFLERSGTGAYLVEVDICG